MDLKKQAYIPYIVRMLCFLSVFLLVCSVPFLQVRAISGSLDNSNIILTATGTDSWTASGDSITGQFSNTNKGTTTGTLTISCASDATISFDWKVDVTGSGQKGSASVELSTEQNPVTITGGNISSKSTSKSGKVTKMELLAGEQIALSVSCTDKAGMSDSSASISITNIVLTLAGGAEVTLKPAAAPENLGYTVEYLNIDKTSASADVTTAPVTRSIEMTGGLTIPTIISSNYKYVCTKVGWTNGSSSGIYRPDSNGCFFPVAGDVLTPCFAKVGVNDSAPFLVGTKSYWTWEDAFTEAGSNGTVILANNYTLPTRYADNGMTGKGTYVTGADGGLKYEIKSGQTLLIPNDDAHTGLRNSEYPQVLSLTDAAFNEADYPTPYAKGTLTVGENTTIASNGTLIISGKQVGATWQFTGSACGPYGLIKLTDSTSKLHIQSGKAYCYGYITGDGLVEVNSGATLYELLQLRDWRGFGFGASWMGVNVNTADTGDIISKLGDLVALADKQNAAEAQQINRSFVFSQYYFQNVEADLQLNVGSALKAAMTMNNKEDTPQMLVNCVTDAEGEGFLKLSGSGHLKREYDSTTDRVTYTANCDVTSGSIAINFGVSMKGIININVPIDSARNILAINSNMGFVVSSDKTLTIASDLKLLPEAYINVETGGHLIIDGAELYIYDKEDWTTGSYAYNADICQLHYVASKNGAPTERNLSNSARINVDGDLTTETDGYLFSTAGYSNADKILTGTGKIINKSVAPSDLTDFGKLDEFEFKENNWCNAKIIATTPFVGKLAGVTDGITSQYNSFDSGTYHGIIIGSDNWWYQNSRIIEPTCIDAGYIKYFCKEESNFVSIAGDPATGHTDMIDVEVPATCTKTGLTEGKHCSVCTEVIVAQEEIPATGKHTDTQAHGNEGYMECDGCGKKLFKLVSMNANADARTELVLKFEVHSDLASEECVTVAFDSKGDTEAKPEIVIEETESGNFVYVTQPVASALMTEDVTVSFSNSDETVYLAGSADTSVSRSIVDYAHAVLKSSSTTKEAKDLVTYLVTYGGYAQLYFAGQEGYEDVPTDYLAYNVLEELRIPIPSLDDIQIDHNLADAEEANYFTVAQNAYLGAAIKQDVFFVMQDGYTISGEITLTYKDKVGGDYKQRKLTPVYDSAKKEYCLTILNIPAAFLDYDYTLTGTVVHTDGTSADFSVTPSITAYLGRILAAYNARNIPEATEELVNLAKAMYRYNQAANVFFNDTDATVVAEMEVTE